MDLDQVTHESRRMAQLCTDNERLITDLACELENQRNANQELQHSHQRKVMALTREVDLLSKQNVDLRSENMLARSNQARDKGLAGKTESNREMLGSSQKPPL